MDIGPCSSYALLLKTSKVCLLLFPVPETCKASLEDIDVLFETSPTWLIGPSSKKKLADIIKSRSALCDSNLHVRKESTTTVNMVEDTSSQ